MQDKLDQIGRAMQAAWTRVKKAQTRMWGEWMTIGEGLLEGRRWAMQQANTNRPEGKGFVTAYSEWLHKYRVDDMHKADRAKLLQLMEERPAVEEWRATLTDADRRSLNHPTHVWRKWTAATRVRKPRADRRQLPASATIEQQGAYIAELEEELAARSTSAPEQRILELQQKLSKRESKDGGAMPLSECLADAAAAILIAHQTWDWVENLSGRAKQKYERLAGRTVGILEELMEFVEGIEDEAKREKEASKAFSEAVAETVAGFGLPVEPEQPEQEAAAEPTPEPAPSPAPAAEEHDGL
jgi:hypothetical protein